MNVVNFQQLVAALPTIIVRLRKPLNLREKISKQAGVSSWSFKRDSERKSHNGLPC